MGATRLTPALWNDCVDLIPRYREMKQQKRTDDFLNAVTRELLQKHPGADKIPNDTPFRIKLRNWFGNQGRLDRTPQKIPVTDVDEGEDGKTEHKSNPHEKLAKKGKTPAAAPSRSKEHILDLFGRGKRKHISYETYRVTNWENGLKERVDENWERFNALHGEVDDVDATRARFAQRFAAFELASHSVEVKKQLLGSYSDMKTEGNSEGITAEEHQRIQALVELADNQQCIGPTLQEIVDRLHKKTGFSYVIVGGGPDIMKNGGLSSYACATNHAYNPSFESSAQSLCSDLEKRFANIISEAYPSEELEDFRLFPESPHQVLDLRVGAAQVDTCDEKRGPTSSGCGDTHPHATTSALSHPTDETPLLIPSSTSAEHHTHLESARAAETVGSSEVGDGAVEGRRCDTGESASEHGDATYNVDGVGPGSIVVGERTVIVTGAATADKAQTSRRSTVDGLDGAASPLIATDTTINITRLHDLDHARVTPNRTNASVITDSNDSRAAIGDPVPTRVCAELHTEGIAPVDTSSLCPSHPDISHHVPSTAGVNTLTHSVTSGETECVPSDEPSSSKLTEPRLQHATEPCQNTLSVVDGSLGNEAGIMGADDEVPLWVKTDLVGLRKMGETFDPESGVLRKKWDKLIDIWIAHERQGGFNPGDGRTKKFTFDPQARPTLFNEWLTGNSGSRKKKVEPRNYDKPMGGKSFSVSTFCSQWRKWYENQQPQWCKPLSPWPPARPESCEEVAWEKTRRYGKLGIVTLLIGLGWWGTMVGCDAKEVAEWEDAVDDVTWVIERMVETFQGAPADSDSRQGQDAKVAALPTAGQKRKSGGAVSEPAAKRHNTGSRETTRTDTTAGAGTKA